MISKETILRGFPIKPLGEVAEFLDSRRRPITAFERIPGPYPYYGANGQQDSVADYIFDEPLILLAEDGGLFDQPDRGIAFAIEGKTWVNNHAHVLRPRDHARLRYLVRVLENYDVTPWITGSTRAKLTKAGAFKIQIPLPPLAEQKRIAGILDAADALRAKRREALAQLDTLLQSTFLEMFGDPVTNPMGWEKPPLEDLCEKVIDCPHSTPRWSGSGVICLRTSNLGKGEWNWADTRFVIEEDYTERTRRSEILPNDIILSREGTVGVLALVDEGMRLCMGQRLVQLRVNDSQMDPRFLLNLLLHDLAPERLSRLIAGSTSKHLNVKELRKLPVLLPPLDIQHRFAAIVESVEQQKASQRAHLAKLDTLFASLQSRAFRGDL